MSRSAHPWPTREDVPPEDVELLLRGSVAYAWLGVVANALVAAYLIHAGSPLAALSLMLAVGLANLALRVGDGLPRIRP